jgi:hypothetical protein
VGVGHHTLLLAACSPNPTASRAAQGHGQLPIRTVPSNLRTHLRVLTSVECTSCSLVCSCCTCREWSRLEVPGSIETLRWFAIDACKMHLRLQLLRALVHVLHNAVMITVQDPSRS